MEEKKPVNIFKLTRVVLFFVLMYLLFTRTGMDVGDIEQSFPHAQLEEVGENRGKGNFVGIQPWMYPIDYASEAHFLSKMEYYMQMAQEEGWFGDSTIVVFPEYIGTWLVTANERSSVYTAETTAQAMRSIVFRNLPAFGKAYVKSEAADKATAAIFAMKSRQMASIYHQVFSQLAKKYQVSIVAGSILLSQPSVTNDTIIAQVGPLYNVSALFYPTGKVDPRLVYKAYPTADEQPFCAPTAPANLPVYETSAGKLGVLICADSWFPECYETLKKGGATLLAIPSYSAPDSLWQTTWKGYSGAENPIDVDAADIGTITEGMAWLKYSMGGRAQQAGITHGINVFLRGNLWDLGTDGSTIYFKDGGLKHSSPENAAVVSCLWL